MSSRAETPFDTWWTQHYPGLAPAAYVLRQGLATRWLRIHSLPGGKRYPTSAADRIDLLFRHERVADDGIGFVVFVSFETARIYAPYDGGADLFLASESRRDQLKATWIDWLSTHPLGL